METIDPVRKGHARVDRDVPSRGDMSYWRRPLHPDNSCVCPSPTQRMMSRPNRILIVEDDPYLARILTRAFRMRRFEAVSVRDRDDALAAARTLPPDHAVVDLRLGEDSGMELIGPLKAINPAMRILVLTGYASLATAVDAIKLGAAHYMAKPAHIEEIMSALGIDPVAVAEEPAAPTPGGKRGLDDLEWKQIVRALRDHGGNLSAAARALGMYRRTLQRKLAARKDSAAKDLLGDIRERAALRRRRSLRPSNKG